MITMAEPTLSSRKNNSMNSICYLYLSFFATTKIYNTARRGLGKIDAMPTISLLEAVSHFIDRYVSILYSIGLYGMHPKELFSLRRSKA
jgi:hypothetical protein